MQTAPQIRVNFFKQIHEIIFHGKGGYDYYTIYNMPLWLRKFTFHEIRKFYQEEKEAVEKQVDTWKSKVEKLNPELAKLNRFAQATNLVFILGKIATR